MGTVMKVPVRVLAVGLLLAGLGMSGGLLLELWEGVADEIGYIDPEDVLRWIFEGGMVVVGLGVTGLFSLALWHADMDLR